MLIIKITFQVMISSSSLLLLRRDQHPSGPHRLNDVPPEPPPIWRADLPTRSGFSIGLLVLMLWGFWCIGKGVLCHGDVGCIGGSLALKHCSKNSHRMHKRHKRTTPTRRNSSTPTRHNTPTKPPHTPTHTTSKHENLHIPTKQRLHYNHSTHNHKSYRTSNQTKH